MKTNIFENMLINYQNNNFSHAHMIETNDINKCFQDIKKLIIDIIKYDLKDKFDDRIVTQIENDTFPELVVITSENEIIKKESIQELQIKFRNKPTIATKNFYIILKPELMNPASSNTILKFLEEPEEDIIGILITSNQYSVLSTITSRCTISKVNYNHNDILEITGLKQENYVEQIEHVYKLVNLIEKKNLSSLFIYVKKNFSKDNNKEIIINLMKIMLYLYYYALNNSKLDKKYEKEKELISLINSNNSLLEITLKIKAIEKCLNENDFNVNLELILDRLFIEMRKSNE